MTYTESTYFFFNQQPSLLTDDDHLLDRSLKEPMPGTSRSMMEFDAQHMMPDDSFGGDPFERE